MVDYDRLMAAYETARCDLHAECEPSGHWVGRLASSALSTATAISALALVERHAPTTATGLLADEEREGNFCELIFKSLRWLVKTQNPDGGWGDTPDCLSNIATTMLVRAAFQLTCVPADDPDILARSDKYIAEHGGVAGLRRRYGKDKTFAAPILTNCALAGLVPWRDVPSLPFELACLPAELWKSVRLPVVSYAIPALVAIGQARFFYRKPWNPLVRFIRGAAVEKSLRVLEEKQPTSGGFLEATPLTSFVVMSLASIGRSSHPVVRHGVEFLLRSVRADGSWPIDTNLATWNTTLAINALAGAGEDVSELECFDWLLACQYKETHVYTGAAPGAWAWTDLSGSVPDVDDTSGALLALAAWANANPADADAPVRREKARAAAVDGVRWLLDLQNRDGGWPTFCRGWGTLPFDRSGADLSAHALRALHAWRKELAAAPNDTPPSPDSAQQPPLVERIGAAVDSGVRYLTKKQLADGHWDPLWFGNQYEKAENNPVYGTARVLLAMRDLERLDTTAARRALDWLSTAQNRDGGWGGRPAGEDLAQLAPASSVEETALAVETLISCGRAAAHQTAAQQGLKWLVDAVEANRHTQCSPIGFYFAKLWYHERLYPLVFTVAALGQAVRRSVTRTAAVPSPPTTVHLGKP